MDSSFTLPTSFFSLSNISKFHKHHLTCIALPWKPVTRQLTSHHNPLFPSRPLSSLHPILHHRFDLVLKSATSSGGGTCMSSQSCEEGSRRGGDEDSESDAQAITLDVRGISSDGSAATTVQRILENHPQVYVASVNRAANSVIVWPVSEAKAVPNWQMQLGEELEKLLMSCGFKSKYRDLDTLHGSLKKTPYSDWTVEAVSSRAPLDSELESNAKEVEALKVEVKNLLLASKKELTTNIEFINSICRLGVSHHFEEEINEHLDDIFARLHKLLEDKDYDLCTTANLFRVMRLHGYNITCDVFERFRDGDGKFKEDIANDVKGILCLYEACFHAFPGENILDDALSFTRKRLQVLAENSSNPQLERYIRTALMFPSHWNGEMIDALYYISFYEQNESANEVLLRFAKLSFNGIQLLYKRELAFLSRWWADTNFMEKFPYVRDRLAESYLWSAGLTYEPEHRFARMVMTKYTVFVVNIDDTYDIQGTIEQLQHLTNAHERRMLDDGDEMPKYMKNYFKILFEDLESNATKGCFDDTTRCPVFDDLGTIGTKRCSYKTTYLAETMIELAKAYMVEAKWKNERKAPSIDEYIKLGKVTSAVEVCVASLIVATEYLGMKEILWVRSDPPMIDACQLITRLVNDLIGRKDSKERRDFPKVFDCYMKQYEVSEGEAIEVIQEIIDNKWKVLNQEMVKMKASNIPKVLLKYILNFARMTYVVNGQRDGYTYPTYLKEVIRSLYIDPLPM